MHNRDHVGLCPDPYADPRLRALDHTLVIATAETEDELVTRTLEVARDITDAAVAAIIDDDGVLRTAGDQEYRDRLRSLAPAARRRLLARAGRPTTALKSLGLPLALTASLGTSVLLVTDPRSGQPAPPASRLLEMIAAHARAARQRLRQLEWLHQRANSDPLTGLRHHRPFGERLSAAVPGHTAVIAIDVDFFKKINDEYGHPAGDQALCDLADALRGVLRGDDELYRIGGDEFAVVVGVHGPNEAIMVAERLLAAARAIGHTISVGVAMNEPAESGQDTLRRADVALYEAKRAGRDTARLAA